ncbi:MAG: DNA mismatch repair endonuclease MutL [Erysipelotrichaceae bacterium]|nr:DNA mismatch repair endonuclease MutL [Erysipelotrichaceae bacterium]
MGRIHQLDEHLRNMIAAGEVVERPAGVVKELVENAVDAKATRIEVQITQGGIDSIVIIDDGIGMDAEDARLAFERHATSKLKEEADLWNIHTMGFRGEALPSIAAVSQVTLKTNNGTEATEVMINFGEKQAARATAAPQGTMIEVRNLFQKTPARFKHLKSPQYEFSLILDMIQKFALAHPEIAFYLSHDGKTAFQSKGNDRLQEVMMQIYGRDVAKGAIAIDASDYDYHISGFAAQPQHHRATKYYMTLFVNHRMIRSYHLQKAIIDAFHAYMPKDRYPIAVLNIEMDTQLVDVNVHPSKWEIRLSKEKQLEKLLYQAIDAALKSKLQIVQADLPKPKEKKPEITELEFTYARDPQLTKLHQEVNEGFTNPKELPPLDFAEISAKMKEPITQKMPKAPVVEMKMQTEAEVEDQPITYPQYSRSNMKKVEYSEKKEAISLDENVISQSESKVSDQETEVKTAQAPKETMKQEGAKPQNECLPSMQVIGQFHQSYILAQGEAGLYIIDQHAAQERYHFEVIKQQILSGNNDTQPMLIPISLEVDSRVKVRLNELNEAMSVLGIQLEEFGNNALILRDLPTWMQQLNEEAFLQDLIDQWLKNEDIDESKLRHLAIATMACHSSIRFHRSLTHAEMQQVIDDLGKCEQPFHCPHGRPTFICITDEQLTKQFLR